MKTSPIIEADILSMLQGIDLSAKSVHLRLLSGGHQLPIERVYEHLVHLEARHDVRIAACCDERLWSAR